ncbi:MAG: hypothetical protein WCD46_03695, partial [Desulfobacterales bacterium]
NNCQDQDRFNGFHLGASSFEEKNYECGISSNALIAAGFGVLPFRRDILCIPVHSKARSLQSSPVS